MVQLLGQPTKASSALEPQNPMVGVFPAHCAEMPTRLILKRSASTLAGNEVRVMDEDGGLVLSCRPGTFPLENTRVLMDGRGKRLCRIHTKAKAIRTSFIAEDASQTELFRIINYKSYFEYNMEAQFANAESGIPTVITLKGDLWRQTAELRLRGSGVLIGRITRQSGLMQEMMGYRRYIIEVAVGVDLALVAAICVCYCADEVKRRVQRSA